MTAPHPLHPTAFTRQRKLPLPALVALLLSGMRKSVQSELDEFFAHLRQQAQLVHQVSAQAFAQARAKLSLTAIPLLNDWVLERATHYGFVPRWHGLRLVGADASSVRFGLRASHVKRAALADQIVFGLFLPGAELMLATSLHSVVTLRAPERRDVLDYECPSGMQKVRLVRHIGPNGQVRVLMTNLFDVVRFPASRFGDLYHQRWRIEEAFKRLKHRLKCTQAFYCSAFQKYGWH